MNWVLLQLYECPCSGGTSRPLLLLGLFVAAVLGARWISKRSEKKGGASMNAAWKAIVLVALIGAVGIVFALKQRDKAGDANVPGDASKPMIAVAASDGVKESAPVEKKILPRLVDLGAGTCIPCKMMMPVLAEIKKEYADRLSVEFYDVWEDPGTVQRYKISVIPTQILYDASGNERFRHEGFFSKEDILAKWKELGVDLSSGAP